MQLKKAKMKGIFQTCFVTMAVVMLVMPLTAMFLRIGEDGYENRELASFPSMGVDGVSLKSFPELFDTYFSENFGLRPYMITLYSSLVYNLTGDSVNDKVIAGRNGWLFFRETLDDYVGGNTFSEQEVRLLYRVLYLQYEYLSGKGSRFIFVPVPNKHTIYGEYMPERYGKRHAESNLELINAYLESRDVPFLDLREILTRSKGEGPFLYHRKDTHWNNYGAMLAYRGLMRQVTGLIGGFSYDDYAGCGYKVEKSWRGDLEKMLMPAFDRKDYQVVFQKEQEFRFLRPVRTYEDIYIETRLPSDNRRILMYRDSFANALIPYISDAFGYACYSRAVPFDYSLADRVEPDIVVLEIAERNLRQLLETAPLMPAPQRMVLAEELRDAGNIDMDVSIEQGKAYGQEGTGNERYTAVHGRIITHEPLDDILEIHIALCSGNEMHAYEAFPVLDESCEDISCGSEPGNDTRAGIVGVSGQKQEYAVGFSMLLDVSDVPDGEYEIMLILRTERGYFSSGAERSLTVSPVNLSGN